MELNYFFSVLAKRKWLLLAVAFLTSATTYFLVKQLPKNYRASGVIQTGIVEFKGLRVDETDPFKQEFEIEGKFANLIEGMKARPAINALTIKLILHDLAPDSSEKPFRSLDTTKLHISTLQVAEYLSALEKNPDLISASDADLKHLTTARAIEKALGYDYETLFSKIEIKRVGKSDYVKIDYVSENPKLTFFVAKNFVEEVVKYYYSKRDNRSKKSYAFYDGLTKEKKRNLDSLNYSLNSYSQSNGIVALDEQSQSIVAQIKDLEQARDEEYKKLVGYVRTDSIYNTTSFATDDAYAGSYKRITGNNREVADLQNEISKLTAKYVETGAKDAAIKKKLEELKGRRLLISERLADVSVKNDEDPRIKKQTELYLKKKEAESNLEASKKAVNALNNRIRQLNVEKFKLVKNNADVKRIAAKIEVAQKEYENAIEGQYKADVTRESSEQEEPMRIIEKPLPPIKPESSKAALLSGFAGVGIGSMATVFLFILTYFDRSISSAFQFNKLVCLTLLGVLNRLNPRKIINFDYLFSSEKTRKESEFFKESLRKIRHDIEASGAKSFLFTSLKPQEGKSFLVASLAYTFTLKNKRVLIIDTNFKNNTLTGLTSTPFDDNPVTGNGVQLSPTATNLSIDISLPNVAIVGNKGGNNSPSELLAGVDFRRKIEDLATKYDYIFLEAAALNRYSDARELVDFVEKVIPVFDATTAIKQDDENGLTFLRGLGDKLLGSVLNKADLKSLN